MGQSIQEWTSKICERQPLKNLLGPFLNMIKNANDELPEKNTIKNTTNNRIADVLNKSNT